MNNLGMDRLGFGKFTNLIRREAMSVNGNVKAPIDAAMIEFDADRAISRLGQQGVDAQLDTVADIGGEYLTYRIFKNNRDVSSGLITFPLDTDPEEFIGHAIKTASNYTDR